MSQSVQEFDPRTTSNTFVVFTESGAEYTVTTDSDPTSHAMVTGPKHKEQKVFIANSVVRIGAPLTYVDNCDERTRTSPVVRIEQQD